jgi:6-pyruvoyltetrahydropterin/6-carboxytetrahydropterin synthase
VNELHEISLGKEDMKFSSAHFTLFPTSAERLHGHNYRVLLTLRGPALHAGLLLDFATVKQEARRLCAELDEALLLPGTAPDLTIARRDGEMEIRCRAKRYVVPEADCRVLPIANVSCECLAAYFCRTLVERLQPALTAAGIASVAATVEESPGQSGRCEIALGAAR